MTRGDVLIFIISLIGAALGFFLLWFLMSAGWIYFWFYFFPFLIVSLFLGGIFRFVTTIWFRNENSEKSSLHYLVYNYKALNLFYPVLIFLFLLAFYFNPTSKVIDKIVEGKKGKPPQTTETVVLEWPGLNKFYNDTKKSWYKDSFWTSIQHLANEPDVFDRHDLGISLFCSLFLGGPLFFFFLSVNDEFIEGEAISRKIADKVLPERQRLKDLISNQEKYIESVSKETDKLNSELRRENFRLEEERKKLEEENQVLQAKIEFINPMLPSKDQENDVETRAGLLDKDIL